MVSTTPLKASQVEAEFLELVAVESVQLTESTKTGILDRGLGSILIFQGKQQNTEFPKIKISSNRTLAPTQ